MTFQLEAALVAMALLAIGMGLTAFRQREIRRAALLEGATVLLRRASTKWATNIHAAIEAEQCAMVLERMAGAEHVFEPREVAA